MRSKVGMRLYPNAARDEAAAAAKRARRYEASQAPDEYKPSVGVGKRGDGFPAFAQVAQRGESAAKAECLGLVERLRGGK